MINKSIRWLQQCSSYRLVRVALYHNPPITTLEHLHSLPVNKWITCRTATLTIVNPITWTIRFIPIHQSISHDRRVPICYQLQTMSTETSDCEFTCCWQHTEQSANKCLVCYISFPSNFLSFTFIWQNILHKTSDSLLHWTVNYGTVNKIHRLTDWRR